MLTELHIENIAVIERADIEPGPGLNVLTGETGAGKSIVIDSLEAILGARASRELVRTGAQNAAVSAVFDDERAARWLVEHDLEPVGQYDPDTGEGERIVIRRRISAEGKSSALVNGENVTAAELRQLGALLLDIHGQNDGRQLMDETRHRDYLDGFAGLAPQLERQGRLYEEYRQALSALRKLEMTEAERERREREYRMTADELAAANIRPGEEEQLGQGVSYCATCDGMFYRGRRIAVLSGSAQGVEESAFLAGLAAELDYYRLKAHDTAGLDARIRPVEEKPRAISRDGEALVLHTDKGERRYDGIFIFRAAMPLSMLLADLRTEGGYIPVDRGMRTNIPGVFAAGDCTGKPLQVPKAVGEGNIAAISAAEYIAKRG